MRLLTYNIHKGIGNDRRYRLDRIVDVIRAEEPDVVCLQEVDRNVRRSRFDDQPLILAEQLGAVDSAYQLNVPRREGGYGNLVLSRWPLRETTDVGLRYRRRKPRAAQLVVVDAPAGPVHVVNWHLSLTAGMRKWQAVRLLQDERFRELAESLTTLVVGDSNDWRNSLGAGPFAEHGFRHVTDPVADFRSYPAYLPVGALDKAFLRCATTEATARVVRTPAARRASDHLPIVVDLDFGA